MSAQANHGGRVREAAEEFGIPESEILDFSSNLNVFFPEIDEESWARWRTEASCYPECSAEEVAKRIGLLYKLDSNWVMPTAGGVEAIYLAARLFPKARVAVLQPGFSDYRRAFLAADAEVLNVDLEAALGRRNQPRALAAIESAEVVIFGNPNNPTAESFRLNELILRWPNKVWLVDEAFLEFAESPEELTLASQLGRHENVILLRSLTKSWRIPGLRLGYAVTANSRWMWKMKAMQPPWAISGVTQAWAHEFLTENQHNEVKKSIAACLQERHRFMNQLAEIETLKLFQSDANFFLMELRNGASSVFLRKMSQAGLLLRSCDSFIGLKPDRFLRCAVRLPQENEKFLEVALEILV